MKGEGLNDFEIDVLKRLETLDRHQDIFIIASYLVFIALLLDTSLLFNFEKFILVLLGFILVFVFFDKFISFMLWLLKGSPVKLKIRGVK